MTHEPGKSMTPNFKAVFELAVGEMEAFQNKVRHRGKTASYVCIKDNSQFFQSPVHQVDRGVRSDQDSEGCVDLIKKLVRAGNVSALDEEIR